MISDAFGIYSANLGVLVATSLAVAIVFGVVIGLLNDSGGALAQFLAWIVQLIGTALYTGFVVRLVQDVRDGRRDMTVGELFAAATPAIGSLIIWSILSGIAIGIGFVLLIVPGLILMTIWAVGAPAIVAEGVGPIEAFGRSYELVRGQAWTVFGVLVCVFLIMIVACRHRRPDRRRDRRRRRRDHRRDHRPGAVHADFGARREHAVLRPRRRRRRLPDATQRSERIGHPRNREGAGASRPPLVV